jgi:L-lactate dehydrogenase
MSAQRRSQADAGPLRQKIGVVGAGMVGSASAFAMVMRGVGREIVLVDVNGARAEAEANDIFHAVPFANPMTVRAGDYADLEDAQVVVIAGGVAQKPGETRLQLLQRNAEVFREIVPAVVRAAPEALLLIVTNPVDIMTHVAARFAAEYGVAASRVVGSGTTLDTARFRALLGRHFDVDPQYVHGYVIGEHGDSEVLVWSQATIAGLGLDAFAAVHGTPLTPQDRQRIDDNVRRAADHIIAGKGATYYGIGSAVARIVDVLVHDQRAILTVCARVSGVAEFEDVTLALPRLLGGQGVLATIPLALTDTERDGLRRSAGILRDALASLQLQA